MKKALSLAMIIIAAALIGGCATTHMADPAYTVRPATTAAPTTEPATEADAVDLTKASAGGYEKLAGVSMNLRTPLGHKAQPELFDPEAWIAERGKGEEPVLAWAPLGPTKRSPAKLIAPNHWRAFVSPKSQNTGGNWLYTVGRGYVYLNVDTIPNLEGVEGASKEDGTGYFVLHGQNVTDPDAVPTANTVRAVRLEDGRYQVDLILVE